MRIFSLRWSATLSKLARLCSTEVRVRFAPSPTGEIHLGGLRTALYNFLFARSTNGKFILRIEDTDQTRLVPGSAEKLENILDWMGLTPDESPLKGGPCGPYVQSQRLKMYSEAAERLIEKGLAYKCFCTEKRLDLMRREAVRTRTNFKYDGRCRHLTATEINEKVNQQLPYTIRFRLDETEFDQMTFNDLVFGVIKNSTFEVEGDPILIKSDGFPTYHLANVVDDHDMKISHVLRGQEWQVSTPKHLMLYQAFGWKPPVFAHLPLIINDDGSKLSKRQSDIHLQHYKDEGFYPEAIINFITLTGGAFKGRDQSGETLYNLQELIDCFDLSTLKTNSCQVNFDWLQTFNQKFIEKKLSEPDSARRLLEDAKIVLQNHFKSSGKIVPDNLLASQLQWAKGRLVRLKDLTLPEFSFLWIAPTKFSYQGPITVETLRDLVGALEHLNSDSDQVTAKSVSTFLRQFSKSNDIKFPLFMKCLRLVLSGLEDGPPVGEMIQLLGKEETLQRITIGIEILSKCELSANDFNCCRQ